MTFRQGIFVSSIPGCPAAAPVLAAFECGQAGVLSLEWTAGTQRADDALRALIASDTRFSISIPTLSGAYAEAVERSAGHGLERVVLTEAADGGLTSAIATLEARGLGVWVQVTSLAEAVRALEAGAGGLIVKGNEAGGRTGEETTLVLLQRIVPQTPVPVFARGGVGLRSAAACLAGGAAGVVLDWQLALCGESGLSEPMRAAVERLDGSETAIVGQDLGRRYRIWMRPGDSAASELRALEERLLATSGDLAEWDAELGRRIAAGTVVPMGQDASFAAELAASHGTVGAACRGLMKSAERQCRVAARLNSLGERGPLAESHGTRYPIAQGPMTRVSDRADFAVAVAEGGALPFLALALMRGPEVSALLAETKQKMAENPWGVGILGFVPRELRDEQMKEVRKYAPPFAIIAGGRPDQAKALEAEGTRTYLHVPSPELLRGFLENGARRVIFEGRECGGHVGPRSSFVLWDQMIRVILRHLSGAGAGTRPEDYHVFFAGGIHDALSAAMVSAMAAPLSERGVRVGVLLGTGYLFTEEAVASGAITPGFQREAIECGETILLETGVGHSTRCADTAFGEHFAGEKRRLLREGKSKEEIREALERLNLGRLRIAAKGIARDGGAEARHMTVDETTQRREGMYMIGQVAALRSDVTTIAGLHADVAASGSLLRARFTRPASAAGRNGMPAIAVVGMSCVFPKAPDLPRYWRNILDKVNAIGEVPKERWDTSIYFDADRRAKDKVYSKWGGFIGDVPFDPTRYGMPPNTVPSIEPMQLLTLEMVRRALEDAGYHSRRFARERTSVVVGTGGGVGELGLGYGFRSLLPQYVDSAGGTARDAEMLIEKLEGHLPDWTEDSFAGLLLNVVAGRVANRFDLGGTNFIVDAACATSLAALRLGVNELQSGSSDVVIAASSDMMQTPFGYLCFSKTQALSPTGQCRTFDEAADGIVISEGIAVAVLKRLEDAENDGDEIYAVIRAVGASSDGRDKGLTAPRPIGQIRALERAYEAGAVDPSTVGLIEAHGTGTVVGDRTEVESLTTFFRREGAATGGCALGSVKSMVGHTKCSAGMAGLIKAAMAVRNGTLPPTGGVTKPNAKAGFQSTPFYLNTERRPWFARIDGAPRRAGVSAFGFGGTNFHAVIEEHRSSMDFPESGLRDWPAELFVWRAESSAALAKEIGELAHALGDLGNAEPRLAELAAAVAWQQRPVRGSWCLAVVAATPAELRERLETASAMVAAGQPMQDPRGIYFSPAAALPGQIALLFPGQGSQRVDMLADLALAFPNVRQTFEAADRALADRLPLPLTSTIFPVPVFTAVEKEAQQAALRQTRIAQAALGAADMAVYGLLKQLGIRPAMAAGHSYGEFAALCAAGAIGFDDLALVSEARGRYIEEGARGEAGEMAAVDASAADTRAALEGLGEVWVANLNSPRQTVIAGTSAGLEAALARLSQTKLNARKIPVACAFHSPLVAPAAESLARELDRTAFAAPRFPVYSNTTAAPHESTAGAVRQQLSRHLTEPVRFADELEAMYEAGARVFIEAGPGKVLSGLASQVLGGRPGVCIVPVDQPGRPGLVQLMHALAQLAAAGVRFDAAALWTGRVANLAQPLARVLESSRPEPHPPTTWMITAGRSVPIQKFLQPAQPAAPKTSLFTAAPQAPRLAGVPVPMPPPTPAASRTSAPPAADPAVAGESPLLRTHRTVMSQMLETHRAVMMAALGSTSVVQAGGAAAIPTPVRLPLPVAAPPFAAPPVRVQLEAVAPPLAAPLVPTPTPAVPRTAPVAPPLAVAFSRESITARLLDIVSQRTGYPPEMLNLDLDMEADLGIDSIKRVEILGELQSASLLGDASLESEIESLTRLKTLRAIIDWIVARVPVSAAEVSASTEPVLTAETVTQRLLEVVSQRTGYPPEMLNLDLDMEADLGIDSIKRVEILGELQSASLLGDASLESEIESLTRLKTLRAIIDWIVARASAGKQPIAKPAAAVAPAAAPAVVASGPAPLVRMEARAVPAPVRHANVELDNRGVVVIVEEPGEGAAARALAARLTQASVQAEIVRTPEEAAALSAPVMALVYLPSLLPAGELDGRMAGFEARFGPELGTLYRLARQMEAPLRASGLGSLIAATRMGGTFGLGEGAEQVWPGSGAVCGFVKAVSREWTGVNCKAVDFGAEAGPSDIAEALYSELATRDGLIECGYRGRERYTIASVPAEVLPDATQTPLDAESVVVITGGARGITAEIANALAERYQPRIVLMGRSALPGAEDPELAPIRDDRALKTALIKRHSSPAAVEAAFRQTLRERETRTQLAAMEAAGARVEYVQVDAGEEAAFTAALEAVYARHGRIDGVIHGAGVIEDKLLADKTPESFERVLRPKVNGALALARTLRPDGLRFLALFSSVSARYGNRGQCDYAAANETLNKLAGWLARRWPSTRVVSLNWGPWQASARGGMVSAELAARFAEAGVQMVTPEEGREAFLLEVSQQGQGPAEVLFGGPLPLEDPTAPGGGEQPALPLIEECEWSQADASLRVVLPVDPRRHAYLLDHCLDGRPVMPIAMVMELAAEMGVRSSGRLVTCVRDVRLLQGIGFDEGGARALRLQATVSQPSLDGSGRLDLEVFSDARSGPGKLHYRARAEMGRRLPKAPAAGRLVLANARPLPMSVSEAYSAWLFHGPRFAGISEVEAVGENGIIGTIETSRAGSLFEPDRDGNWQIDPVLVDSGLQLIILWARATLDMTPLPSVLGCYHRYAEVSPGVRLRCEAAIERQPGNPNILVDLKFFDGAQLVGWLEQIRATVSRDLNRLAKGRALAARA